MAKLPDQLKNWTIPAPADKSGGRSTVTHEWGHLIDGWVFQNEIGDEWKELRTAFMPNGVFSRNNPTMKPDPDRAVSRYGASDHFEAVAEGFAALKWLPKDQWTEPLREFKRWLDDIAAKIRTKP